LLLGRDNTRPTIKVVPLNEPGLPEEAIEE